MSWQTWLRLCAALVVVSAVWGCGELAEQEEGASYATQASELKGQNVFTTSGHAEVYRISIGRYGGCTALQLTPRWLLTSAHCVKGQTYYDGSSNAVEVWAYNTTTGNAVSTYRGRASFYSHPNYTHIGNSGTVIDPGDDFAMVLLYGDGTRLASRNARLYADSRNFKNNFPNVSVVGTGRTNWSGTTTGGWFDGLKRVAIGACVDRAYSRRVVLKNDLGCVPVHICEGDSGGPIFVSPGLNLHVGLASSTGLGPDGCSTRDARTQYTRIEPKMNWVINHAATKGVPIACPTSTVNGVRFRRCS